MLNQVRRARARAGLTRGISSVLLVVLTAGCSATDAQQQAQPMLSVDRTALAATTKSSATGPSITEIVRRGTLKDSLSIPGRVVAADSTEMLARTGGTVTALNVHPGQ